MSIFPRHFSFKQKLDLELAKRSRRTAILYLGISLVCVFTFSGSAAVLDRVLTITFFLISVSSIYRWIIAHRIFVSKDYDARENRIHKAIISVAIPLWTTAISLMFYQSKMQGVEGFLSFLIAAGFAVGSIISLSPARALSIIFPVCLLTPIAILSYYLGNAESIGANLAMPAFILLSLVYCIIQSSDTRRDLVASIQFEESLIKSNESLIESQKKLEEETAKATHSSRLAALGEMAGGIAHEINNPLMIIKSHAVIIHRSLEGDPENPFEQGATLGRLNKIVSAVQRVANIVKGLRNFAQQGDLLPLEEVSLSVILSDTLDFCHEKLTQHSVKIHAQSLEQSNIRVLCRSVQISQVFLNLINNSYDAIKDLEDRWIKISLEIRESQIYIYFQDSGLGIQKSSQEKIFQPFFTTKDVGHGTGLGLSISRGILRGHNGDLHYLPAERHTTFLIQLPVSAGSASGLA